MKSKIIILFFIIIGFASMKARTQIEDGVYLIYPESAPDFAIELPDNGCYKYNFVKLRKKNRSEAQKWQITSIRDTIRIHPYSDYNYVLNVPDQGAKTTFELGLCGPNDYMNLIWIPEQVSQNKFRIHSTEDWNHVIGLSPGGNYNERKLKLQSYDRNNPNQIWVFEKTNDRLKPQNYSIMIPDGVYYIYPANKFGFALDLNGNGCFQENNIQDWERNYSDAQKWIIQNDEPGILIEAFSNSDYVIDNSYCRIANGNNIFLGEFNGGDNQFWVPQKVGNNRYRLRLAQDPNYVMDSGNSATNGCNVLLWENEDNNLNQVWIFERIR